MHYRSLLRVARREGGVRLYAVRDAERDAGSAATDPERALDALLDVVVAKYAPLPERSLSELASALRYGAPQWHPRQRDAFVRARSRLPTALVDGQRWYWPQGESPASRRHEPRDEVRLLAPFDPVVWDRRRFEALWGWAYRFEAYTPPAQRKLGYYAMPLLWRDAVIGWATFERDGGAWAPRCGFVAGKAPREAAFRRALDDEIGRLREFLAVG